jgi:CRP/FNR family cyclic AMP-dependent transcriptional regulator
MLDERAREALLALGAFREYPAGALLITEGDSSRYVIALHGGWVKVVAATEQGGLALLALRSRGELIGEQAALENQPRTASVIAAGPVTGYVVQPAAFLRFLAGHPDAALTVTRALSAKLRWATNRRVEFSGLPVRVRLARVLCDLARMNSTWTPDGVQLGYRLTQPELAAMIGTSDPSVQRAMGELRAQSLVATGYRTLVILDLPGLAAIAGTMPTGCGEPLI